MTSLYFHIPFCARACTYCDYYFITEKGSHQPFVDALLSELDHYAGQYGDAEPLKTIYIGGGTPSRLSLAAIDRILQAVYRRFDTSILSEITIEVNPEDLTLPYLQKLRKMGVNRLTVGIQSFYQQDLELLGRRHTPEEAETALALVPEAGFSDYSIDLLFGLPGQPIEYWQANLERAVRAEVPHLAIYRLTDEPDTVLGRRVERDLVEMPSAETANRQYLFAMDYLRQNGYEQYEISSFARPGFRSAHNQRYWNHENYIGLGPSAHSFRRPADGEHQPVRWNNIRNVHRYRELLAQHRLPLEEKEKLSPLTLANEHIMLRLQTAGGLDLNALRNDYHVDLPVVKADALAWLEEEALITWDQNNCVRLTDDGKLQHEAIASRLLVSATQRQD